MQISRRTINHYSMSPVIFHYHIFKNAGTSFNHSLQEAFGPDFLEYDPPTGCEVLSSEEVTDFILRHHQVKAVSSHQACFPIPQPAGRMVHTTLLLRDPIARVRSIYLWERNKNIDTPGAVKAKELDFKEYVHWRLKTTPTMLCNYQVHYCSRTRENAHENLPGEAEFKLACANLDRVSAVGTVESYQAWLSLVKAVVQTSFPDLNLMVARKNVSEKKVSSDKLNIMSRLVEDLGHDLVAQLLASNQLDMRLHQVAEAILHRKLAEWNIDSTLQTTYEQALRPAVLPEEKKTVKYFSFLPFLKFRKKER